MSLLPPDELQSFLDQQVLQYNQRDFIEPDPIAIPHLFQLKEDIEIAGFLTATIAWGNRKMILKNAHTLMELMGNAPFDFVMEHNAAQLSRLASFQHRTFNGVDAQYFIKALRHIYLHHHGMEGLFTKHTKMASTQPAIHAFKQAFFELPHEKRTQKHVGDPLTGSAAKRLNMMLRWFCRKDKAGVDFGIWKQISPAILSCPLDVHSGNMARALGLLTRKQNDAKAVMELDKALRAMDPLDPVKYDFALFGVGVNGGIL